MAVTSFASELRVYVGRVREFDRRDWHAYLSWVGLMVGLTAALMAFLLVGQARGARFPTEAWLLPAGAATFTLAIAVDTIGHLTVYKESLQRAEGLVHQVTIACGITSCVLLCASYSQRALWFIPATVFVLLSFLYSLVDEAFHWHRYWSRASDRVEMWSHVFILIGHGTMIGAWWLWCARGYPGVGTVLGTLGHRL
jgi:hypothetical protein